MTWLFPSALVMAAVAVLAAAALHFIARSRPIAEPLPTARFIPERAVHARTRSIALTDVLLLLLRAAALLVLGGAVAGPIVSSGNRIARIVIADRSRAVADGGEVRDSVRRYLRGGDRLVMFDSSATFIRTAVADSFAPSHAPGSLSAALAAATRAGVIAAARADSVELVLVSPLAYEELDAATSRIRAAWPGRIHIARVRAAESEPPTRGIEVRAPVNDAVAAGVSLMGMSDLSPVTRVVRGSTTPDDSAWARAPGHVLVHWPAADSNASWSLRPTIDAIGGVVAGRAALIARFPRPWVLQGRVVARWADGEPAAVERETGGGCIRDIAILIDESSDVTLRSPFRRFVAPLLAPCGGARPALPLDAITVAALAGRGALAAAGEVRDRTSQASMLTPWLLIVAALLLIVELAVRRTARGVA
jgi:hypothetical protein